MADHTYGNPLQHTDQYGNPVPPHHTNVGGDTAYGVGTAGYDSTAAQHGQPHVKEHHGAGGVTGILHRSGSSSSSSSEDDGMGGRRKKKGLKEKVKEKMPGGHKTDEYGRTQVQQPQEKKGMMEKVKEKIPGGHNTTDEYGHTQVVQPQEKKGMMEKIKEKLPGSH